MGSPIPGYRRTSTPTHRGTSTPYYPPGTPVLGAPAYTPGYSTPDPDYDNMSLVSNSPRIPRAPRQADDRLFAMFNILLSIISPSIHGIHNHGKI